MFNGIKRQDVQGKGGGERPVESAVCVVGGQPRDGLMFSIFYFILFSLLVLFIIDCIHCSQCDSILHIALQPCCRFIK